MKNFQVIEKIELSRVWEAPATTAYAALDMFREGRARFIGDVPARPRPLVSVSVVDPDSQADFTEKQLDKEMAEMVGPPIDTVEGLEEALALEVGTLVEALTMPPAAASGLSSETHLAALEKEIKDLKHDLASAEGRAKNATTNCDYWKGQYETLAKGSPQPETREN